MFLIRDDYRIGIASGVCCWRSSHRRDGDPRRADWAVQPALAAGSDRITQALAHDRRSQEQAAVLFIDLNHFKII